MNNDTLLLNQLGSIGHGRNGTNIVINNPMNNSEYFCSDSLNNGEPYYIFVAGKYVCIFHVSTNVRMFMHKNKRFKLL